MALLSELIRHDKPLFTGTAAVYPYQPSLEKKYRFTSRFGEEVLLHKRRDDYIELPRALCPVGAIDRMSDGDAVEFPKGPSPRPYQAQTFDEITKMIEGRESGVVVAMTGWGKTVAGFHAAYVMQKKTLVITTKEDIYDKWIEGARDFLGLQPHEIGEIRGDKCEVVGTKFVVALIQSLSKDDKYPSWITKGFGLVIFDETHRVAATQFSAVADMFPARVRMGLSATPERQDGKELLVYAHIGPIRIRAQIEQLVPKVLRFKSNWECPRVFRTDQVTHKRTVVRLPHQAGKTTGIEKRVAADNQRNGMIGHLANTAYRKGRKIVIFSTLHDHLHALDDVLRKVYEIPAKDIGMYVGTQSKAEKLRRDKESARPILLTTYTMMGEGTDIPWLDTCILAMPRSHVTQPIGRIRRQYDGKADPVVIDIMDFDSPVFTGYANNRLRWYQKIGAEIIDMTL